MTDDITDEIKQLQDRLNDDITPITRQIVKRKFITFIKYLNDTPSFRTNLHDNTLSHIKLLRDGWAIPMDTLQFYYALKEHHTYITGDCKNNVYWMDYLITFQKFRVCRF
jgi:hypothetical protein